MTLQKSNLTKTWKEGMPAAKCLKENCWEASSKESELIRKARQAYYMTHCPNCEYEGSYNLFSTFWEMASSANLMSMEVHEVQECGLARKTLGLVIMWPRAPLRTSTSLGLCYPPNHPRSWTWGEFIPPGPCNSGVGYPSVHGAEKRGKTKVWW